MRIFLLCDDENGVIKVSCNDIKLTQECDAMNGTDDEEMYSLCGPYYVCEAELEDVPKCNCGNELPDECYRCQQIGASL